MGEDRQGVFDNIHRGETGATERVVARSQWGRGIGEGVFKGQWTRGGRVEQEEFGEW